MPRRTDLKKILLIGSGPIVIGQACEFDYSGTQACKALREEGYEVVLVNSNPATIMTDPETADRTYIEPITWDMVARVLASPAIPQQRTGQPASPGRRKSGPRVDGPALGGLLPQTGRSWPGGTGLDAAGWVLPGGCA
jgi:hypothetical protein